jgi:hypothetical protein
MGRRRRGGGTPPEVVLTNKILIIPRFPDAVTHVKIGSLDSFITRIALFYLKHLPTKDNLGGIQLEHIPSEVSVYTKLGHE